VQGRRREVVCQACRSHLLLFYIRSERKETTLLDAHVRSTSFPTAQILTEKSGRTREGVKNMMTGCVLTTLSLALFLVFLPFGFIYRLRGDEGTDSGRWLHLLPFVLLLVKCLLALSIRLNKVDSLGCSAYTATACVMITLRQGFRAVDDHWQHTLPEGDPRALLLTPDTRKQEVHDTQPDRNNFGPHSPLTRRPVWRSRLLTRDVSRSVSLCKVDGPHRDSTTLCTSHRQLKTFRATASLATVLVILQY